MRLGEINVKSFTPIYMTEGEGERREDGEREGER